MKMTQPYRPLAQRILEQHLASDQTLNDDVSSWLADGGLDAHLSRKGGGLTSVHVYEDKGGGLTSINRRRGYDHAEPIARFVVTADLGLAEVTHNELIAAELEAFARLHAITEVGS